MREFWRVKAIDGFGGVRWYNICESDWTDTKSICTELTRNRAHIIVANMVDKNIVAKVVYVKKVPKKFKVGDKVWVRGEIADADYNIHIADADYNIHDARVASSDIYVKVFNTTNNTGIERVPATDIKRRK